MQLYVGQSFLKGDFARYAKRLNLLELLAEPHRLPKVARLRSYRAAAPPGFVFSVVLSPAVFTGEPQQRQAALSYGLSVAQALGARYLVLRTPPQLRPGAHVQQRLAEVTQALPADSYQLVWEPKGLWQPGAAARIAAPLGMRTAFDLADSVQAGPRHQPRPYVRIAGLGTAARVNEGLLERAATQWVTSEEVVVVADAPVAARVRELLTELLALEQAESEDELDDDSEDVDSEEAQLGEEE